MAAIESNPLLGDWSTKHQLPPFKSINSTHYEEALRYGMQKQLDDMQAICDNNEVTFDSVIAAFDRSGATLTRVGQVYYNLCSSDCPPELQAVQLKMASPLAAHSSAIYMYPNLFSKIEAVYNKRFDNEWNLTPEQIRLVERIHLDFVRAVRIDQVLKPSCH